MGGGGPMRAAAKAITVANSGLLGIVTENSAYAAARKAVRPTASAIASSESAKSGVSAASQNCQIDASSFHRHPSWEIDDWEFAGPEEELNMGSGETLPRLVFGGAPTLQEARAATSDLKDALERVYLSSPGATAYGGSYVVGEGIRVSSNSDELQKACVASETTATPKAPKHAMHALRLLNETPAVQDVVAAIVCDSNVWNAVFGNATVQNYVQSHKLGASFLDNECVADTDFLHPTSPRTVGVSSDDGESGPGNVFADLMENMKLKVIDMMNGLCDYFQKLFGAYETQTSADTTASPNFWDKNSGAYFMGLAVMVIMVVVLKRA